MNEDVDTKNPATSVEIILDKEKGLKIKEGPSTYFDQEGTFNPPRTEVIAVTEDPHVFNVSELRLIIQEHKGSLLLKNVNVILGDGEITDGQWKFKDGGNVVETVEEYNRFAPKHGRPKIDAVIVCNPGHESVRNFSPESEVAYVVGEMVRVESYQGKSRVENGKAYMEILTEKPLIGQENLTKLKQI